MMFKRQIPPHLRNTPGTMNKTEQRYADEILKPLKLTDQILDYKFEALKFRLAKKTFYTPDFFVTYPTHFEVHEVKGYWQDDARVKIKVAAKMFPFFKFVAIQWKNKKVGWLKEEF